MSTKTVLITGCSANGIGAALAATFQKSPNYTIVATARDTSKIDPALTAFPNIYVITLDVTSSSQIQAAAAEVTALTSGTLDILINNAGSNYTLPLLDVDIQDAKKAFDVNFWGPIMMSQIFAPLLIKANGVIVNVSSIAGVLNTPYMGIYGASKAALTLASETLRLEMAPLGVRVITVAAGNVETNFWSSGNSDFALPSGSFYSPVAEAVESASKGGLSGTQHSQVNSFARQILDVIEKEQSGVVWKGALAGSVRWISRFMPTRSLDKALSEGRGLDELQRLRSNAL